jgi:hypothetical protein
MFMLGISDTQWQKNSQQQRQKLKEHHNTSYILLRINGKSILKQHSL